MDIIDEINNNRNAFIDDMLNKISLMKVKPGPITKAARILRKAGLTCDEATEAAYLIREIVQKPGGAKFLKKLIREQVKPNEGQNSNSDERSRICN